MKAVLSSIVALLAFPADVGGFQFMSKWKSPVKDPLDEMTKDRFGDKKLVVVTGTSSGLGRKAALALLRSGEYHVVGAVRDLDKMEAVAEVDGFDMNSFTPIQCELNSFDSVRRFCKEVDEFRLSKPIDRLICNAGVYQPTLDHPKYSLDGHEQTMQINYLSHFLMISQLMEAMIDSTDPRVIMVGSVTGNDNTVGGGGVYPIADLHELDGFKAGFKKPIAMADGYGFIGAKAYKDSKLCLMMMANFLHTKYHKLTGVSFSSMYPGCIAESPLFREKRAWFRKYFPIFMKFITGGFVGEHEAGQRLFQTAHDPRCSKSGVYWSWNGGPREGRGAEALEKGGQISGGGGAGGGWDSIFENDQSSKVLNIDTAMKLWEYSNKITGAEWPELKQVTSPCPTLKVIGAVTKGMVQREELKRMQEMGRPGMEALDAVVSSREEVSRPTVRVNGDSNAHVDEAKVVVAQTTVTRPKLSRRKRVLAGVDRVTSFVLGNTIGRVGRLVGRRLLGEVPDTAKTSNFYLDDETVLTTDDNFVPPSLAEKDEVASTGSPLMEDDEAVELIQDAIAEQLKTETETVYDTEDEAIFQKLYERENKVAQES